MSYIRTGFYAFIMINATLALYPLGVFIYIWFRLVKKYEEDETYRKIVWVYGRIWVFITKPFASFKTDFSRTPRGTGPAIIVANHQSFFDMYCFGTFFTHNVAAVVKDWVFKIPTYGFIMKKAGYINISDNNINYEEELNKLTAKGVSLLIFPEGSRSQTKQMGRFHSGAFLLSIRTNTPIIPVCIDGTFDFMPKHRKLINKAAIKITSLAPVYPEDFEKYGDAAHIKMKTHIKRLMEDFL